jgi:hypothetical protein
MGFAPLRLNTLGAVAFELATGGAAVRTSRHAPRSPGRWSSATRESANGGGNEHEGTTDCLFSTTTIKPGALPSFTGSCVVVRRPPAGK